MLTLRLATAADAEKVLAIYSPYIEHTAITFEYDVPDIEAFRDRIVQNLVAYPWLVCEDQGEIIGYAYASLHRYRTAYQWSTESTVYVKDAYHGRGVARRLYEAVFDILRLQGYLNVYAGIALPNPKSEHFHRAMGFTEVGVYRKVGYKFNQWHDVAWLGLALSDYPALPNPPLPLSDIMHTEAFEAILAVPFG